MEDQIWQGNGLNVDAFDFTPSMEASYRVKIEGRLLEHEDDQMIDDQDKGIATEAGATREKTHDSDAARSSRQAHKFSYFFKALTVEFDRSRFRNGAEQTVEWKKPDSRSQTTGSVPSAADFDELTFKRNGDENMNVIINLFRQETPEKYQLSPELAEVIDMSEATQQEAVMGLWEYIKMQGLQEDEEKRNFRCDELLRKVVHLQ